MINARDHGADPTGKVPVNEAMRSAVAAAQRKYRWVPAWLWLPRFARRRISSARTVYLPSGNYRNGGAPLTMPPGTSVRGNGTGPDGTVLG